MVFNGKFNLIYSDLHEKIKGVITMYEIQV